MKNVQEAINYRYSARKMDPTKKISTHDLNLIIEAGIKAPSGFGCEPWKFLVIDGDKSKLAASTYSQPAVANCSQLIVYLYALPKLVESKEYMVKRLESLGLKDEKMTEYHNMILNLASGNYMKEQSLFAASQMVIQAAGLGIDTLIMGGFNPDTLADDLKIDKSLYAISVITAFGYSLEGPKVRTHRETKDVVEFITI